MGNRLSHPGGWTLGSKARRVCARGSKILQSHSLGSWLGKPRGCALQLDGAAGLQPCLSRDGGRVPWLGQTAGWGPDLARAAHVLPGQMRLLAPHHRWKELLAVLSDWAPLPSGAQSITISMLEAGSPAPTPFISSWYQVVELSLFSQCCSWRIDVDLMGSFPECCGTRLLTLGSLFPTGETSWCGCVLACGKGYVVKVKLPCGPQGGASASLLGSGIFFFFPPQRPSCLWRVAGLYFLEEN